MGGLRVQKRRVSRTADRAVRLRTAQTASAHLIALDCWGWAFGGELVSGSRFIRVTCLTVHPTIGASAAGGSSRPADYTPQHTETKPTSMRSLIDRQLHARVGWPAAGLCKTLRYGDIGERIPGGSEGVLVDLLY